MDGFDSAAGVVDRVGFEACLMPVYFAWQRLS